MGLGDDIKDGVGVGIKDGVAEKKRGGEGTRCDGVVVVGSAPKTMPPILRYFTTCHVSTLHCAIV